MFNTYRVKQTQKWANRKGNKVGNKGAEERLGTVVGCRNKIARVLWDGNKHPQAMHLDFLDIVDDPTPWPDMTGQIYPNRSLFLYQDHLYSEYKRKKANSGL